MKMENTEMNAIPKASDKFPCKACGGNMVFDPISGSLKCPYCSNLEKIDNENSIINEYDLESADERATGNWGNETSVIQCSSCGAQTVLTENSAAQFCAFCGSSHILKNDAKAGITPESLIPFKITKDAAIDFFKKCIRKKFFAPNNLKNNAQLQKMNGVYIPHWTYDCDTASTYTAEAGTYYYVSETIQVQENGKTVTKTHQVRKIRWRFVSGDYAKYFNDVLVNASSQVNNSLIQNLGYNLSELIPYKPAYLSGYLAERYSIDLKAGWNVARSEVDDTLSKDIKREINSDEVRSLNVDTNYNRIKFKHILLPVWISTYTYKKKLYSFMVNGQNGKVNAKAPLSIFKIAALTIAVIGILLLFLWLYNNNNVQVTT